VECTVCEQSNLIKDQLEERLPCLRCQTCGGSWLEASAYADWRKASLPDGVVADSASAINLRSAESPGLKFCPQCCHILIKYKVGHETNFSIDRCGYCAGVWLDKNEWELLKAHELHDQLYEVFSQEWQSDIRAAEHKEAMENILKDRLGEEDYKEFTRIKSWLDNHKKSVELYALLFGSGRKAQDSPMLHRVFNAKS
jgi:Zn-finger nucleic acid-binding protein